MPRFLGYEDVLMNGPKTKLLSQIEMRIGAAYLAHHPGAREDSSEAVMISRFHILKMSNVRTNLLQLKRNHPGLFVVLIRVPQTRLRQIVGHSRNAEPLKCLPQSLCIVQTECDMMKLMRCRLYHAKGRNLHPAHPAPRHEMRHRKHLLGYCIAAHGLGSAMK